MMGSSPGKGTCISSLVGSIFPEASCSASFIWLDSKSMLHTHCGHVVKETQMSIVSTHIRTPSGDFGESRTQRLGGSIKAPRAQAGLARSPSDQCSKRNSQRAVTAWSSPPEASCHPCLVVSDPMTPILACLLLRLHSPIQNLPAYTFQPAGDPAGAPRPSQASPVHLATRRCTLHTLESRGKF